jgi:lysophospholipase L1-like esterase
MINKTLTTLLVLLVFSGEAFSQDSSNFCLKGQSFHIVILGSSTAAGAGPSVSDSAWVNRFRTYLQGINPQNQVTNLAIGGTTTYHIMPSWFVPPPNRPLPNNNNVTQAVSLAADAIIVNMPSNDASNGFGVNEQMFNFHTIVNCADSAGIPVWVCTTQPKASLPLWKDSIQVAVKDSVFADFGIHAIDFWTTLALANNKLDTSYDSGDGTHLNDAGHRLLFERTRDKNILTALYDTIGVEDHAIIAIQVASLELCGDSAAIINGSITNLGIPSGYDLVATTTIQNLSAPSLSYQYDTIAGGVSTCQSVPLTVTVNTWNGGNFSIRTTLATINDTNLTNDTSTVISFSQQGRPALNTMNDTACANEPVTLIAQSTDSVFWFSNPAGGTAIANGDSLQIAINHSTTDYYAEARRGPFHYSDELLTTASSSISWNGVMFDIVADTLLTIDSLMMIPYESGQSGVVAWYRQGSHYGAENDQTLWTLWGKDTVLTTSIMEETYVDFPQLTLSAGDTIGVYLHMEESSKRLRYQGMSNPATIHSAKLSLTGGTGVSHTFGSTYTPRLWHGKIFYHYGVNPQGVCSSGRIPVRAFTSQPVVDLGLDTNIWLQNGVYHTFDAGPGYTSYLWSTGDTTQTVLLGTQNLIDGPNTVWVNVADKWGCTDSDTLIIYATFVGLPEEAEVTPSLRPNPSNGQFQLTCTDGKLADIVIFTMSGSVVFETENLANGDILSTNFPPGMYLAILKYHDERYPVRLIVR